MRYILTYLCLAVVLAFLVACTSNEEDVFPLTQETPPAPTPTVIPQPTVFTEAMPGATLEPALEPTQTPAANAVPEHQAAPPHTPAPTATPMPTATPVPTPTPSAIPAPIPTATPFLTPAPAATPAPVAVLMPTLLSGVPREVRALASYENEGVYSEVQALVSGQNSFVADFYRYLAEEADGNLFYSPYSLYMAMAVVYAGAAGNTAAELQNVMGIAAPPDQFHRNLNSLDLTLLNDSVRPGEEAFRPILSVANGLWVQDGLEIRPGFLNTVTANYGIGLAQLDFRESPDGAVNAINQWVDEATQGKIKGAINRKSITDDTSLVVTNAVYFKGDWEDQFQEENTTVQPFYLLDGLVVQVPMMYQSARYRFHLGEGYQAVGLPYRGNDFDLVVVMPDEGTFTAFEESLTGERLQAITDSMGGGEVILEMPRFKLEYDFSAKKGLQALGLTDAFDRQGADFRPIAERLFGLPVEELWIEDAVQKAFVEVNEKGSEAAAVTAFFGGTMATSIPPPPVPITIDQPFIFLLRHAGTGAVLFMGRVLNPAPDAPTKVGQRPLGTPTPVPQGLSEPPQILKGTANLNGATAPLKTVIKAFAGGRAIGWAMVGDNGEFTLLLLKSEGPITFTLDGVDALETLPEWISGSLTPGFNLTAGGS